MAKQINEICNLIAEVNTRNQKITELSEELKKEQQKSLNYYFKYKKAKNKETFVLDFEPDLKKRNSVFDIGDTALKSL